METRDKTKRVRRNMERDRNNDNIRNMGKGNRKSREHKNNSSERRPRINNKLFETSTFSNRKKKKVRKNVASGISGKKRSKNSDVFRGKVSLHFHFG